MEQISFFDLLEEDFICDTCLFDVIGYVQGLEDGRKRPQGEWIFDKENSFTIDMFKCSICVCFGAINFNFCPKCGADMRKVK